MQIKIAKSLDEYQMYYEDMEMKVLQKPAKVTTKKPVQTNAVKKPSVISRVVAKFTSLKSKIFNRKPRVKYTLRQSKLAQLEQKKARRNELFRGIIGIGLLLVVVSITRSTFVSLQFVDGVANVVYLLPQIVFAIVISIIAFLKIYK